MSTSISNFKRHPDWENRLVTVMGIHRGQIGEWGQTDCLMTCGDVMQAVVGHNPLAQFIGKYDTESGARKILVKNKCKKLSDVFENFLELEEINRLSARRGDMGIVDINQEPHAGYFTEHGFAVKQPQGQIFLPITDVTKAFKIGV